MFRRVYTTTPPFPSHTELPGWGQRDHWPAHWVDAPGRVPATRATAYRLRLNIPTKCRLRIHVTADQRYQLFLDGQRIAQGSERGNLRSWFYESYELELEPGRHTLGALTWHLAEGAPWAQDTSRPGFLLAASEPFTQLISTGRAPWEARWLPALRFIKATDQLGGQLTGMGSRIDWRGGSWASIFDLTDGGWNPVSVGPPGNNGFYQGAPPDMWILRPATLPAMARRPVAQSQLRVARVTTALRGPFQPSPREALARWQAWLQGGRIVVPPRTRHRLLVNLADYFCAYYRLRVSGGKGSRLTVHWAERLSNDAHHPEPSADRREVDGLHFVGAGDTFRPDGSRHADLEPLWWMAGRWVQITIQTGAMPLTLESFCLEATGYPLREQTHFACDDSSLNLLIPACRQTLRACMHETYMDCPYWEQLQYIGDTRIQALITYAVSPDIRLAAKALDIFSHSRVGASPFPSSNHPSRSMQIIPPFALWWINMLRDLAWWRGEAALVRRLMPTAWWIVDHFLLNRDRHGLAVSPPGWNYVDAVAFAGGEPPGARPGGTSGLLNWQLVLALDALYDLGHWLGDPRAMGARLEAQGLARTCERLLWDARRRALADDVDHTSFSEHGQALPLLTGRLSAPCRARVRQALLSDRKLHQGGLYFSHYILEAMREARATEALVQRLQQWQPFLDAGLKTFPEHDLAGRSDCHAWSAHPWFHLLTSLAGIRPAGPGFSRIAVTPLLGPLHRLEARIPHPLGLIHMAAERVQDHVDLQLILPANTHGLLHTRTGRQPLRGGTQLLRLAADEV